MKTKRILGRMSSTLLSLILIMGFCASCEKDDVLSVEADIVNMNITDDILTSPIVIDNNRITCYVKYDADISQLAPTFELSEGATIIPASGTPLDFTTPQSYVVTSQNGKNKKTYVVSCVQAELTNVYHFDHAELLMMDENNPDNKFYGIYEEENGKKTLEWASGNMGFSILAAGKSPEEYPTSFFETGYEGACAKLVTRTTGELGAMFSSPMAAGNLFVGSFQLNITNTLASTHFGLPFYNVPNRLVGYYKYQAGEKYIQNTDENGIKIPGGKELDQKDQADIYAVLYETTETIKYLDGTNILTSPRIVSLARVEELPETDEWTKFSIPFKLMNGRTIDAQKLNDGGYNLAIVFSSSKDGDKFNGAVGSTLYIDEVNLVCDK